jgi:hypothetical protein
MLAALAPAAAAETLAAPPGAAPIAIPGGRIACGAPLGGWTIDPTHHLVRPPAKASPGTRVDLAIAASDAACSKASQLLALVVTAPWPTIEHAVLSLDDGQLVLRGHRLAGIQLRDSRGAHATCDAIETEGGSELCRVPATADTGSWSWLPAGAGGAADEALFDSDGHAASSGTLVFAIDRIELAMLLRPDAAIDAFSPGSTVQLRHADRIAAVDCAPASCVLDGDGLLVSGLPAGTTSLPVRVRLGPHVVLRRGDAVESSPVVRIPIVRCPISVVSGPPLRGIESQTVVVEVGGRCGHDLERLRFQVAGVPAERARDVSDGGTGFVVLRIGRTDSEALAIAALSDQSDTAIAQLRVATRAAPPIRVAVELGNRAIDFIPTNLAAHARVTSPSWDGTVEISPIEGVYTVERGNQVRGLPTAGGVVAMRVALRRHVVPPVGDIDLATVAEPVERPLHEATSFAPLFGKDPLVELLCDDGHGPLAIAPGATAHVPFDHKDSCRIVLHRERLAPALGEQRLTLEVDVTRVDGSPRSEARVSRRLHLEHDETPRTLWLRGADSRFDRYTVRLSQDDDEHVHEDELPSAQWSVITGRGRARVYATSAITVGS